MNPPFLLCIPLPHAEILSDRCVRSVHHFGHGNGCIELPGEQPVTKQGDICAFTHHGQIGTRPRDIPRQYEAHDFSVVQIEFAQPFFVLAFEYGFYLLANYDDVVAQLLGRKFLRDTRGCSE